MTGNQKNFFFYHDLHARNDRKIRLLLKKFKHKGYSCFFMLLELIGCEGNCLININDNDFLSYITDELFLDNNDETLEIINYMIKIELLNNDGGVISSKRLSEHMEKVTEISKIRSNARKKVKDKSVETNNNEEIIINQYQSNKLLDQPIKSTKPFIPSQEELNDSYKPYNTHNEIDFNQFDPSITGKYFISDEYKFLKDCLDENITEYFEIMPDLPYMKNKLEKEAWEKIHDLINTGVLLKMDEPERFILECCQDAIERKVHKAFQVTDLYNQMVENIELGYDNDPDDELLKNVCKRFKSLHNSTN